MKRLGFFITNFCVLVLAAVPVSTGSRSASEQRQPAEERPVSAVRVESGSEGSNASLRRLLAEVSALRRELLEERIEIQEERVASLKRELQLVQVEKQRLEGQEVERSLSKEEMNLRQDPQAASGIEQEDSETVDSGRTDADLRSRRQGRRSDRQGISQWEAAVLEQLQRAERRQQELLKRFRALGPE